MPRALICPPTQRGSLGDEAMVEALSSRLAEDGYEVHVMTPFEAAAPWTTLSHISASRDYPGGGRIRAAIGLLRMLPAYERVIVIGADVIDGHYETDSVKRMLLIAAVAGMVCRDARLVGFSFNTHPSRTSVWLLRMLPPRVRIHLRDPDSLLRFRDLTRRKARLGGDIAFLLSPAERMRGAAAELDEWISANKGEGRHVVAFNAGAGTYDPTGHSSADHGLTSDYARELTGLLRSRPDAAVALIAHDHRPFMREHEILCDIGASVGADVTDRLFVLASAEVTAREVKALVARCDYVLSGRMHLCVAALGSGTAAGGIPYQDKFSGLFRHFHLENATISIEQSFGPGALQRYIAAGLDSAAEDRRIVVAHLPHVISLAEESIGCARNLWLGPES